MTPPATAEPPADESSRDRILREATHLFAQHGYEGTSLRMIADATAMQKGSLVYHFESKDRIREAVLTTIIDRWKDILPQLMLAATSGQNRFERAIGECTRFFREDPNRAKFLLQEALSRPDELRERIAERLSPWLALLTDRIRQGQDEGRIYPDVDPLAYVWGVVLLVIGAYATAPLAAGLLGGDDAAARIETEIIRSSRRSLFIYRPKAGLS